MHGLNLTVPEDAQALVKPWHEREDPTRFAESGVDDQVCRVASFTEVDIRTLLTQTLACADHHTHSLHGECPPALPALEDRHVHLPVRELLRIRRVLISTPRP